MVYVDRWRESFGSTAAPLVAWYVPRVWASVDTPKPLCNAIRAIREVAQKELPVGYGIEFSGITREESQTGSNIIVIFLICVFFVYLIMVALYESLFVPLAVILGVPFGLLGALLFAQLFGVENNIYLQVGLIMLIGTLGLLFVVPALFVIFQTFQERFKPVEFQPSDDPLIIEELKQVEAYHAAKADATKA